MTAERAEHGQARSGQPASGPEPAAFMALVKQTQGPLLRYAASLLRGTPEGAEDAVQEAYMRLLAAWRKGESIAQPEAWLFRVTRNLALDGQRRASRRGLPAGAEDSAEAVANAPDPGAAPATAVAMADELAHLRLALAALPDEMREILTLKLLRDFTLNEVSLITGLKPATVHYRVGQGLRALAGALDARASGGGSHDAAR